MNLYNLRLQSLERIITRLKGRIYFLNRKSEKFSFYRLIVFIAGAVLSISSYFISNVTGLIVTIISFAAFSVVVHFHNRLIEGMRRCDSYLKIKEENLARMNIDWENIPDPVINTAPLEMTAEKDLDLFGKYSVHNLIDVAVSYEGSLKLRKWLTNFNPDKNEILIKQKIIQQLSGLERFRDKFILKARLVSKKYLECNKIIEWIRNSENIEISPLLFPVSSALIVIYISLFILNIAGIISQAWILFLLIYFFTYISYPKDKEKIIEQAIDLEKQLKKFTLLISYVEANSFKNYPELNNFLSGFTSGKDSAASKLKNLQKIISALLIRENPLIRLLLNILFPYDLFFCKKLIEVKKEISMNIEEWVKKFNELECYITLANFTSLNPDYYFPGFADNDKHIFEAEALGHPLIRRSAKVCNDFSFNRENEIVIITGSNMSGKSTFLRAAGINLCLAYTGAPVNARNFRTSLFELFTCIKVTDSVVDGISYFYAEVKKLKQLLDEFQNDNTLRKFFLIDEIFKGTNNKERLEGSRAYVKKLSELRGTGFISTHDLELVNLSVEIPSIENYHFREEIVNGKMEFDYKIHPGPCPTTNALKIMELSGLPVK